MAEKEPAPTRTGAAVSGDVDRLTGTLARPALDAAAQAAVAAAAKGELIAFGAVGLDGFAQLQAEFGNVVTDMLLRETASRISACLRPQDAIGRIGRDEFLIVFRGLASKFETLALVAKLRTSIAEPMPAGKTEVRLSPSCGIAQYPANGKTVDELMAFADKAMHALHATLRGAGVAASQEAVNRAQSALEAALAALAEAQAAHERIVAAAVAAGETDGE